MDTEMTIIRLIPILLCLSGSALAATKNNKPPQMTPLDKYIEEAMSRPETQPPQTSPGSLWSPQSRLLAVGSDLRSTQVDDLVTIVVTESASAVAQGTTKTQRQSSLDSSIGAIGGLKSPTAAALQNLAKMSTQSQLDGQGATTRSTQLSTILSARITQVLPNGYLVVQGSKDVVVNSERQEVTIRGIVRPFDLSSGNTVRSDQIAQLELKINGKGAIGDAVRRPFILYRLLMGLLPF
jgi:flagellar L-ring protein precursor FlgH